MPIPVQAPLQQQTKSIFDVKDRLDALNADYLETFD
jgi:hypothetical protein